MYIAPTAPKDLRFVDLTINGVTYSVTLTWRRPDPPNGIITQYNVSDIRVETGSVPLTRMTH